MKILHLYKDCLPVVGGIENHIKDLAQSQAAAGHEVTVLATNPGGQAAQSIIEGVRYIRASRLVTVASTPLSLTLPFHLRQEKTDIIHLHFPYPIGELSQLVMGQGRPYVITYHSDIVRQKRILFLYRPLMKRVLKGASAIIVSSENFVNSSPSLRELGARCTVIPFGVDAERFNGAEPLISSVDSPTILFIGRHRYYKGLEDLICAMPNIRGQLLIGGDGPMQETWKKLTARLKIVNKVHFLGFISEVDLPRFYASGDVFVLPANKRAEAFGLVLLEAMATGLPCITTELETGTSFVVQDGVSGFVVTPGKPDALAAAVNRLLENPELCQQMGKVGRERARREFTLDRVANRVEQVYQQALSRQTTC